MRGLLLAWLLLFPGPAAAVACDRALFEGVGFIFCDVDATNAEIRLWLRAPDGSLYGHFHNIEASLPDGQRLVFAMNAGMFHGDRRPVGHYVEDGQERTRVITGGSPGNFGLLPNGIFCIRETRADVIETQAYQRRRPECRYATQSGPMLVTDGTLHPRFIPGSESRFIRNGVGTSADGKRAVFVISNARVNFDTFGRFFRDALGLPNALYFDGRVSRLHAFALDRSDIGLALGPIVGVIAPVD
ncbi:MAG: phosphodiester glycosidase family protein [Pseudomonadota bacterium]